MLVDAILKELDIYSYESIKKPLLASLVTQESILLISPHETGKTQLACALAKAFKYTFEGENKEIHANEIKIMLIKIFRKDYPCTY